MGDNLLVLLFIQDWTPIDRNQIRNRVQLLGSCLYAACQFGCTGLLETGERPEHGENDLIDVETQVRLVCSIASSFLDPLLPTGWWC